MALKMNLTYETIILQNLVAEKKIQSLSKAVNEIRDKGRKEERRKIKQNMNDRENIADDGRQEEP